MEDLSLHVLDIAENSINAGARNIEIIITEDSLTDTMTLEINDDGKGMGPSELASARSPFYSTRTTRRIGMGLALLDEAAQSSGGSLDIHSAPLRGTRVRATFRLGHIDRKPLGNMAETVAALIAGHNDIDVTYRHRKDGRSVSMDTREIRGKLEGSPVDAPDVLAFIRRYLDQEEKSLTQHA